ncbi:MAG: hypothetical protein FJW56_11165, partial [Actinobacteria bacterium]|nr:hypothetical protein [Actinomycetota bacterium]
MNYLKEILASKKKEITSCRSWMNNNSESNGAEYTVKKVLRNQFDLKLSSKKRKNTGLIKNIKSG